MYKEPLNPMRLTPPSQEAPKIKIMLVDDEKPIIDFLLLGLTYEGFEVRFCLDGNEALGLAAEFKPEVIVLDLMLPGMDGLEICRRLRAAGNNAGIVMLTAKEDAQTTIQGLSLGADDYVAKPFDFAVLVARIRSVLRRRGQTEEDILTVGDLTLSRTTHEVRRGDRLIDLTNKEFELLEMFMAHPR